MEFRALAPTFRLLFGEANEPRHSAAPRPVDLIGMAWLYALHARSSIARGRLWQAEYMISGVRDHALALACIRHGVSSVHGRGLDLLPKDVSGAFESSLIGKLEIAEMLRAFQAVIQCLTIEIRYADNTLAVRLEKALQEMTAAR
jgi:hypothetical protein